MIKNNLKIELAYYNYNSLESGPILVWKSKEQSSNLIYKISEQNNDMLCKVDELSGFAVWKN